MSFTPFVYSTYIQGVISANSPDGFAFACSPVLPADGSSSDGSAVQNTVLVGASGIGAVTPGYAYPCVVTGTANWAKQTTLLNDTTTSALAQMGVPAMQGNTAVFGYPLDDTDNPNGTAYVFIRSNLGTWSQQQQLVPLDGAPQGEFGTASAVLGNLAAISSAYGGTGAIYIFQRAGNTWTQIQQFQPADIGINDSFGSVMCMAQVGASIYLFIGALSQNTTFGAVYVYLWNGSQFIQVEKITGVANQKLGSAIACDGTTLAVGVPGVVGTSAGSVQIYNLVGGAWKFQTTIQSSDVTINDDFGAAVAVSGSLMVVGAPFKTVGANPAQGKAYVFTGGGASWTQQQQITLPAAAPPGTFTFGACVACFDPPTAQSWIVIGASSVGETTEGSVFFFGGPLPGMLTLSFKGMKVYGS